MPTRTSVLFLLNLLLNGGCLFAQLPNLNFRHITAADGLSHSDVMDILQDRRGFIWLATRHGLNRYDGHSFKKYFADPEDSTSLSGNAILHLAEDLDGNIWAEAHHNGLSRLDPETGIVTQFHHDPNDPTSLASESSVGFQPFNGRYFAAGYPGVRFFFYSLPGRQFQPAWRYG